MFRENVLIALTILITILALSFIILMTVYLQIHELDRKLGALESMAKKEEEARGKFARVGVDEEGSDEMRRHQELMKRAEAFWNGMKEGNEEQSKNNKRDSGFRPYVFGSITFKDPTTVKPKAPEEDDTPGVDILTQVLTEIQEYEMRKRMQEIENRILGMNGMNRNHPWYQDRRAYYRGGADGVEDGRIWLTEGDDDLQGVTPKPGSEESSSDNKENGPTDYQLNA